MARRGRRPKAIGLPLAKVISTVAEEMIGDDGKLPEAAVPRAYALLRPADHRRLIDESLWRHFTNFMKRMKAAALRAGGEQQGCLEHFGLIAAVALDAAEDGKQIKRTNKLTQLEFSRAIKIREGQLEADKATLEALRRAYAAVKPDWDANPTLIFEEVYELYLRRRGGSNAA